jgi:hypothetical protein
MLATVLDRAMLLMHFFSASPETPSAAGCRVGAAGVPFVMHRTVKGWVFGARDVSAVKTHP